MSSVVEHYARKLVNFSYRQDQFLQLLSLQACDGAEACIISCHDAQSVWVPNKIDFIDVDGANRTSKLSEITGLNLTDLNIEEYEGLHCDQF